MLHLIINPGTAPSPLPNRARVEYVHGCDVSVEARVGYVHGFDVFVEARVGYVHGFDVLVHGF